MILIAKTDQGQYIVRLSNEEAARLMRISGLSRVPDIGQRVDLGVAFRKVDRFIQLRDSVEQEVTTSLQSLKAALDINLQDAPEESIP